MKWLFFLFVTALPLFARQVEFRTGFPGGVYTFNGANSGESRVKMVFISRFENFASSNLIYD
ncbi:MAG: hypothetical protein ACRD2U_13450 [Terriglobales bacterium]